MVETGESESKVSRVLVTGGTGFVGRAVVHELVRAGIAPVCLVRDRRKLDRQRRQCDGSHMEVVEGDLFDGAALTRAARQAGAVIHLVGIIAEQRSKGQTFERVHVEGTRRVVDACRAAGVRRFIHMSALGTRPSAASAYHRTKWEAECHVRDSGLDWTIFRPSVIHGPDSEFMRLMRRLACGVIPPVMPHLGDGQARVQPVSVLDVAYCLVAALSQPETISQTYDLGGPEAFTWRQIYRICRETLPGAKLWKPVVGQPVWAAKLMAVTIMRLPIMPRYMRFNLDQVQLSQEDSVCEVGPVERTFGIKLRDFRAELAGYAAEIGRSA
ncbi:MAG: complex I NDUFA9 subunit family protein [Phycisphaerae bacterium]|nr:complex I NDUFA9 subunit family protein [Phycisphaerae bacterium]